MGNVKEYDIRHNPMSIGDENRWLITDLEDNREIMVSEVVIKTESTSSSTYVKGKGYVYNIKCYGYLVIQDNVAYITSKKEDIVLKRHIYKTVSYRLLSTSSTIVIANLLGMSLEVSALFGFGEIIMKPILYFIHERLWYKGQKTGEKNA